MGTRNAARKAVAAAGIAGWFGFNAVLAFYTFLWRNSPDAPDFAQRFIMPMHQGRRTFYVQVWEQRLALGGLTLCTVLIASAIVLGYVFFRRELAPGRGIFWFNAAAAAAFLVLYFYAAWPLPPR